MPLLDPPKELPPLPGESRWAFALTFSPDGKTLAAGGKDGRVRFWDLPTRKERTVLHWAAGSFGSLLFTTDGKTLAVATLQKRATLPHPNGQRSGLHMTADGRTLATLDKESIVHLRDVTSGKERAVIKTVKRGPFAPFGPGMDVLALTADGKMVAVGSQSHVLGTNQGILKLFDVATGKELAAPTFERHNVSRLAFTPDGKLLIVALGNADPGQLVLWNVANGEWMNGLGAHHRVIGVLALTSDGQWLASGGQDQVVWLWDLPNRNHAAVIRVGRGMISLALSADGHLLAVATERAIRIWQLTKGVQG